MSRNLNTISWAELPILMMTGSVYLLLMLMEVPDADLTRAQGTLITLGDFDAKAAAGMRLNQSQGEMRRGMG